MINYLTHFYVQKTFHKQQFVGDNCTDPQTKTEYLVTSYSTFNFTGVPNFNYSDCKKVCAITTSSDFSSNVQKVALQMCLGNNSKVNCLDMVLYMTEGIIHCNKTKQTILCKFQVKE